MKKLIVLLLFTVSAVALTGCKKDVPEKTTQEKILGKWNFISVVTETTRPSKPVETETEPGKAGDYFDFHPDGKLNIVYYGDKEDNIPYSIESETSIKLSSSLFTIKEITENKFVFEEQNVSSSRTKKTTYNLSR